MIPRARSSSVPDAASATIWTRLRPKLRKLSGGIRGRMLIGYVLLILLAMEAAGTYLLDALNRYYLGGFTQNLYTQGELLGTFLGRYLASPSTPNLSPFIDAFGSLAGVETIVVDRYGRVVGASGGMGHLLFARLASPTLTEAMEGNRVAQYVSRRHPALLLALPVKSGGEVVGVLELRASLAPVYRTVARVRAVLFTATLLALALTLVLALLFSETITRPLRRLTGQAGEMAKGRFAPVAITSAPDEIGELARAFNHLARRLGETLSALEADRKTLQAVLDHLSDAVLAFAGDGSLLFENPAARAVPGLDRQALERLPEGEHNLAGRTFRLRRSPLDDGGAVVVLQDVTEAARLERMRREFVADVSHELRTPLTTVRSYVETVAEGRLKKREQQRFLQVALDETDRMARLVKNLLTLSRLEAGVLRREVVDFGRLVTEVSHRLMDSAAKKDIVLSLDVEPVTVHGDPDRLTEVVLNLLENAVTYTQPGGCVRISVVGDEESALLTVADNGPGIPSDDVPRIFERFYRVEKGRSRDTGGTGLGLAIAKEVTEAHGGTIRLESRPGEGTRVTVRLPRHHVA